MLHRAVAVALFGCVVALSCLSGAVAADEGGIDAANDSQTQDPATVAVDDRLTGAEGTVGVLVRFAPATGATSTGELRAHAADTQADLRAVAARTEVTVGPAVRPVTGENPPDLTGDGLLGEIDGDGALTIFDVQALFGEL